MLPKPKGGLGMASKARHTFEENITRKSHSGVAYEGHVEEEAAPTSTLVLKNLIKEGYKAITEKIDGVVITVALLCRDVDNIQERIKDLGIRADGDEELLGAHTCQLVGQERCLQHQEDKLVD
ncbi:hypothetical protein NDU88_006118 [Pleurodeles waltl]|uniref:Uncharacterized protein n=1 Tax=Pleurodeles waltl TaxID=8319 RepID=A0AAV7WX91_PLEWA|nr:hypothetical protein NDU88_006118 [Pleurodeles waltl]